MHTTRGLLCNVDADRWYHQLDSKTRREMPKGLRKVVITDYQTGVRIIYYHSEVSLV